MSLVASIWSQFKILGGVVPCMERNRLRIYQTPFHARMAWYQYQAWNTITIGTDVSARTERSQSTMALKPTAAFRLPFASAFLESSALTIVAL